MVYAGLAAASAALLLFLPVLLLGITMSVVASVMRGDVVAWRGSLDLTYTFVGIPALLSLVLLVIPYSLLRAAGRRLGTQRATRWVGGLLAAWNRGLALLWVWAAVSSLTPAMERPEIWYALAFAIAAVAVLIATRATDRRVVLAVVTLAGVLAVGLGAVLVAVWGSPPRIPAEAQTVHVVVSSSAVRLAPATVHAGDVYFVVEGPDDPAGHSGFTFLSAGYGSQCPPCDTPLPLSDEAVDRLARGDYQGTGSEGGWGSYAQFTLLEGNYVFVTGAGPEPGVPPQSVAVLEVLP